MLAAQRAGLVDRILDALVEREQRRGSAEQTAAALRALTYVADVRTKDPVLGPALREGRVALLFDRLDDLADRLAPRPDWYPDRRTDEQTTALRAHAGRLFDSLTPQAVNRAVTDILPLSHWPFNRRDAFPLVFADREIRAPRPLRTALQTRLTTLVQQPEMAQTGVVMAVATVEQVLGAGRASDAGAQATSVAAVDPRPAYTAARLRQFAATLDTDLDRNRIPRQALGSYGANGVTLTDHLRTVARNIDTILRQPSEVAGPRATNLFGRDGIMPVDNAVVEVVERAVLAQERPPSEPKPTSGQPDRGVGEAATETQTAPAERIDFGPDLQPEYALLGSLMHAPKGMDNLRFLRWRDLPDRDTQAIYQTLRGLHGSGSLIDLNDVPQARRAEAASENHVKLYAALRDKTYTHHEVTDPAKIVARMNDAAPATALPFDGVYNPAAQTQLGLKVFEESVLRQLSRLEVDIKRDTPLVPLPTVTAGRTEAVLKARLDNLEVLSTRVERISARLADATRRAGLEVVADTPQSAKAVAEDAKQGRKGVPDRWRRFTSPLQHRAERHILHLALHAGMLDKIPQEVLDLAPEHFTDSRHANMWRAIQDLRQRGGEYVNYAALRLEARKPDFAHKPILSREDLARMAEGPPVKRERIKRSLLLVVNSAIERDTKATRAAVKAVSTDRDLAVGSVVDQVAAEIKSLKAATTTALDRHKQITHAATGTQGRSAR
ncbi:hypothetical protein [Saccharothrix sp.]|uniref:hypothetical protein n=1 Tax=Saccharothrix sp. TaxID=1873460 RepID=UPI0028128906|nr:hypothetical protein [Saccharothrix sp.]